jgi:hypothetical protein
MKTISAYLSSVDKISSELKFKDALKSFLIYLERAGIEPEKWDYDCNKYEFVFGLYFNKPESFSKINDIFKKSLLANYANRYDLTVRGEIFVNGKQTTDELLISK